MVKLINLAVAAVAFTQFAAPPVSASQIQDAYRAHTVACIGLFFSDQAAHYENCLPNTVPNIPAHEGSGEPSIPAAAPPPPPPPPLPPEDCGAVGALSLGQKAVLVAALDLKVAEAIDCNPEV